MSKIWSSNKLSLKLSPERIGSAENEDIRSNRKNWLRNDDDVNNIFSATFFLAPFFPPTHHTMNNISAHEEKWVYVGGSNREWNRFNQHKESEMRERKNQSWWKCNKNIIFTAEDKIKMNKKIGVSFSFRWWFFHADIIGKFIINRIWVQFTCQQCETSP